MYGKAEGELKTERTNFLGEEVIEALHGLRDQGIYETIQGVLAVQESWITEEVPQFLSLCLHSSSKETEREYFFHNNSDS